MLGPSLRVVERNYFTCPSRWIYRQTLYHVAVKAGFYRKAVEVYHIPIPCDIRMRKNKSTPLGCEYHSGKLLGFSNGTGD